MANKVGPLIKEARTNADLTQEELANLVDNLSAGDISKAERGEKELTQAVLKQIAKATGVTQKSLLEAAAASTYGESGKSSSKSSTKKSSTKKSSSSKKEDELTLTATEKKLVELYREADSDTKKKAMKLLKGEEIEDNDLLNTLLTGAAGLLKGK